MYGQLYGINEASTILRGTLRYKVISVCDTIQFNTNSLITKILTCFHICKYHRLHASLTQYYRMNSFSSFWSSSQVGFVKCPKSSHTPTYSVIKEMSSFYVKWLKSCMNNSPCIICPIFCTVHTYCTVQFNIVFI